jgi:opacity protein-like surface antigen
MVGLKTLACAAAASALALAAAGAAQAAVTVGGFTLDTGTFGAQTGVHEDSSFPTSGTTLEGYVNQDGSGVTVTSSDQLNWQSEQGSGEAIIQGGFDNLLITFEKTWNQVTFDIELLTVPTSMSLTVNGTALFSGAGCSICTLTSPGANKFTVVGTGIKTLSFAFDPAVDDMKQIRVLLPGPIPEPATWGMMIIGVGGIGALMRRRRAAGVGLIPA